MFNKLKSVAKTTGFVALGSVIIVTKLGYDFGVKAHNTGKEYYEEQKREANASSKLGDAM